MIIINSCGGEKSTARLMHFLQASRYFNFDDKTKIIKTVDGKTRAMFRLTMVDEQCWGDRSCDTRNIRYYRRWMVLERVLVFAGFSTLKIARNSKHILAVDVELPLEEEKSKDEWLWEDWNVGHDPDLMLNSENEKVLFTGEPEILKILEFQGRSKRLNDGTVLTLRNEGGLKVFLSFNPQNHIPIHYASIKTVLKIFPEETVQLVKFRT